MKSKLGIGAILKDDDTYECALCHEVLSKELLKSRKLKVEHLKKHEARGKIV